MATVLKVGLPNMGICCTMACSLVYAHIKNQGIGIRKLYIRAVLDYIWGRTETGNLFPTLMEHMKLEGGI